MTARRFTTLWPTVTSRGGGYHPTADDSRSERDHDNAARRTSRGDRKARAHELQRGSGYNRRSLAETGVYRYKAIIGRRLHARTLPSQRTEAKTGCNVLNRMTRLGMPVSVRVV